MVVLMSSRNSVFTKNIVADEEEECRPLEFRATDSFFGFVFACEPNRVLSIELAKEESLPFVVALLMANLT